MPALHACLIETMPGTPARATVAEARLLLDAGLQVTVVCNRRAAKTLDAELPAGCRRIIAPGAAGRLGRLRTARRFWQAVRGVRADFFHAHSTIWSMLLASLTAAMRGGRFFGDFNNIIIVARRAGTNLARAERPVDSFEHEEHWEREPTDAERQRIEATLAIIPDDARTALDIGCGDGRITNRLAERMGEVTGIDQASAALKYLNPRIRAMRGTAEALPLADRSVDLVLATEVIEHLPDYVFRQAVSEMQRVARKYILIGVPYQEQLANKNIVCPIDGRRFNVNGHLHSFSPGRLHDLFAHFTLSTLEECGAPRRFSYHPVLRWIKQHLGGTWARPAVCFCPECGSDLSPTNQLEHNAIARWCDERNKRHRDRRVPGRSHVLALYERIT